MEAEYMSELDWLLEYLHGTSLEPHDDYTSEFTYKEQKILYNYIQSQNEKIKKLEKVIEELKNTK